ncbi:HAD-IA family hydrolase [Ectothiorhodospiraceae bacterium WFHF3C12]|nr:HAD-IA family hydrolase [Ectothiorhodospiraceae bacterium WFHF3C12]
MAELILPPGTVRAVSFDLDFTLWDLTNVIPAAEERTMAFLAERAPEVAARYDAAAMRELRDVVMAEQPGLRHNLTELRKACMRRALESVGYRDESLVEAAFDVFLEGRHRVHMYDDAVPTLKRLRGQVAVGAVTNGNADIDRIGLQGFFDFRVSAIDVGAAKPDRLVFEAACHRAGVAPHQMLHVGDEPESDVIGAARYGMVAVWLNRSGELWPEHVEAVPHVQVRSLDEVVELVQG